LGVSLKGELKNKQNLRLSFLPNFFIHNRRFLGNKYKLLKFIEFVIKKRCPNFNTFCDIFAGTGVVGHFFNNKDSEIISNDLLYSNYISLKTFLGATNINMKKLEQKIIYLNKLRPESDNYFSLNYGNTYFSLFNAKKIGIIREKIEEISESKEEKAALITSLIYATDKVANTVGHYDAYRKKLDQTKPIQLRLPTINQNKNKFNKVYRADANELIKKIKCDVLYIDPPYNSRQYCDAYHLLENLVLWKKPPVFGKARKMERKKLKSKYCLKKAPSVFSKLIKDSNAKHIIVSYNNTGESKDKRSNACISDNEIREILEKKGDLDVFERDYRAFTTGKSSVKDHSERLFYCKVN